MPESFVHKQPSPLPHHPKRYGVAQFRYRRNRLLPFTARRPQYIQASAGKLDQTRFAPRVRSYGHYAAVGGVRRPWWRI
jgi:hypothetical protein